MTARAEGTRDPAAVLRAWAVDNAVEHGPGTRPGEVLLTLPGEHRLRTTVSVLLGAHTMSVSAFVVRHPDDNHEAVLRWLLRKNTRLNGVAFALDASDDVYLVGRLPTAAVTTAALDHLFGVVLQTADDSFDELLRLGFAAAIRREAAWRASRGLAATNLRAFAGVLTEPDVSEEPPPG